MNIKKYSGLQLYQIDQRETGLKYTEILNNWKNLNIEKKAKYIQISKSLKIKPSHNNNTINEYEFLRRYYLSEIRKQEYLEHKKKITKKLLFK
jgi:hypothetical protein